MRSCCRRGTAARWEGSSNTQVGTAPGRGTCRTLPKQGPEAGRSGRTPAGTGTPRDPAAGGGSSCHCRRAHEGPVAAAGAAGRGRRRRRAEGDGRARAGRAVTAVTAVDTRVLDLGEVGVGKKNGWLSGK